MTGTPVKTYVGPGEGDLAQVFSSALEIKAGPASGLSFGLFRSTFPPGGGMPFLHVHRSYEEAFYVIEGRIQFQVGEDELLAESGSAILVAPGIPHCFRNVGSGDADWIVITTPAAAVGLIEEVGAVPAGDFKALTELFERYDSELLESRPHWTESNGPGGG